MSSLSELVGLIYDAALDESRWQAFLDAFVQAIGAWCASVVPAAGQGNHVTRFWSSNLPKRNISGPAAEQLINHWYRSLGNEQTEGAIRTIDGSGRLGLLQDFCYGLAGVFLLRPEGPSLIAAGRRERDGPFGQSEAAVLSSLIPHLRRALLLKNEMLSLRAQLALITVYLDQQPYPFLLTDAQGRAVYANTAAAEIAALGDGLAITAGRRLLLSDGNQAEFLKALAELAADRGASIYWLEAQRPSRKPPYSVLIMPAPDLPPTLAGFSKAVAALLIIDRETGPELDSGILRVLFALTPAEAQVTKKLGAGRSAEQIAEEMDVSLETVRTHIRRILSKTETGRQGELISLVLRTAPLRQLMKTNPR